MIKKEELRIGNLVFCNETATPAVHKITFADMGELVDDPTFFNPIPLSGEWLIKCGFMKTEHDAAISYSLSKVSIARDEEGYVLVHEDDHEGYLCILSKEFFYLHQLQNLFHILVGKELTIQL